MSQRTVSDISLALWKINPCPFLAGIIWSAVVLGASSSVWSGIMPENTNDHRSSIHQPLHGTNLAPLNNGCGSVICVDPPNKFEAQLRVAKTLELQLVEHAPKREQQEPKQTEDPSLHKPSLPPTPSGKPDGNNSSLEEIGRNSPLATEESIFPPNPKKPEGMRGSIGVKPESANPQP